VLKATTFAVTDIIVSVHLARELDDQKFHTTGTIIAGRAGNPKPVRQGTLRK
jgi:hypothetical protein